MELYFKERAILQAKVPHIKELFQWTQPSGTVQVKDKGYVISLDFAFPDGIQTTRRELAALLKKAKNELDESEKARMDIEAELKGTKEALNRVERERAKIPAKFPHIEDHLNCKLPLNDFVSIQGVNRLEQLRSRPA
ncbi:hypothetical protein MAR_002173 [Mya arenaria]|uniref:Uncharacterized protein n=1 Tax=Mya arenaria TaxID=6604 RepID=A0ABY7FDW0_MYAAR|nr:hypothetical protein MAR_002173 [Mya arenaria]